MVVPHAFLFSLGDGALEADSPKMELVGGATAARWIRKSFCFRPPFRWAMCDNRLR